jgi:hypothetical protein
MAGWPGCFLSSGNCYHAHRQGDQRGCGGRNGGNEIFLPFSCSNPNLLGISTLSRWGMAGESSPRCSPCARQRTLSCVIFGIMQFGKTASNRDAGYGPKDGRGQHGNSASARAISIRRPDGQPRPPVTSMVAPVT